MQAVRSRLLSSTSRPLHILHRICGTAPSTCLSAPPRSPLRTIAPSSLSPLPLRTYATTREKGPAGPCDETVDETLGPDEFVDALHSRGVRLFTGVPDSLMKDFLRYVDDHVPKENHIITANEGGAIGTAVGHYLATRQIPLVYLQNSGLGNAVNPLLSLADPSVYSVPMLLLVGWRGEPGHRDEPQHRKQGRIMPQLLDTLGIAYDVLPDYHDGAAEALDTAIEYCTKKSAPYALFVKKNTFTAYKPSSSHMQEGRDGEGEAKMSRMDALRTVTDHASHKDVFVATTGFTSRELYEIRLDRGEPLNRDFLTVGSMGHASAIALGIAASLPSPAFSTPTPSSSPSSLSSSPTVYCLDGDGAAMMHLGNLSTIGASSIAGVRHLVHIVLNNGVHDSVGGQPTAASHPHLSFADIARAVGYRHTAKVKTQEELGEVLSGRIEGEGPYLIEVMCKPGTLPSLRRPRTSFTSMKEEFIANLSNQLHK
uniref:Phosphonopyruvate decarboxylase n=1 Tax=Palpitomonas bilix TaxID=652834 RepID=A0A7S3D9N7_9EUKA|mmetsp:Transcript_274/g.375  ORF Transcript_274/g.375 Transcript_274/m.375 type:complete len:483 (+) Transcript_274:316-1764(+)